MLQSLWLCLVVVSWCSTRRTEWTAWCFRHRLLQIARNPCASDLLLSENSSAAKSTLSKGFHQPPRPQLSRPTHTFPPASRSIAGALHLLSENPAVAKSAPSADFHRPPRPQVSPCCPKTRSRSKRPRARASIDHPGLNSAVARTPLPHCLTHADLPTGPTPPVGSS